MQPNAVTFSPSLTHRLAQILYRCLEDLGSTKAALYLAVPGTQEFHLVSHYGWPRVLPPPECLDPEAPLVLLMHRERRGLMVNDLTSYPELSPFCVGSTNPRCYLTPIFNRGEWSGMLLQRDPSRGEAFTRERQEMPTQIICQEVVQALNSYYVQPPEPSGAAPAPAPEVAPLRVPAPPTGAMIQVEERPLHLEGEALEHFRMSAEGRPTLAPGSTNPSEAWQDPRFLEEGASEADCLLPEQRTFFWETANLLCRMVPAGAAALYISDPSETRPILTYSRVPLSPELKRQVMGHFVTQLPDLPRKDLRLISKAEWLEREPQTGQFLTLLPVLLEEQFGDDDLLILFRLEDRPFTDHEQEFIRQVSRMLGFYFQEARLHERYHQSFLSVSHRILASAEGRMPTLRSQSVNTAELSRDLARRLQLPSAEVEAVSISAILHDVGTLLLDRTILDKPNLSAEDLVKVRTHPILASTFLKDFNFPFDVLRIIRHHHESWDGRGYPDGISGDAIPIGSRIIHLVESYEVMTAGAPYKAAKPVAQALRELEHLAGIQFDPAMVGEFIQMLKDRHI
jgi:GAF domain-containing protein